MTTFLRRHFVSVFPAMDELSRYADPRHDTFGAVVDDL